jgi:hypothetical protein
MKKRLYLITTILLSAAVLSLSSCLKDSRYVDFSKVGTIVEFPLGGQSFFGKDAITDPTDTIVRQFAINIAGPTAPKSATNITLAVDNSIITTYNAANPLVTFLPMPTDAFVLSATSATIPAGQRLAIVSVTFYKHLLDPSKSYMLPIAITNASGLKISGNQGIHYYHFIGNDFAGNYSWNFQRYNASDSTSAPLNGQSFTGQTATFLPASPTEFTVASGYAGGVYTYDVTFTKTVVGGVASYSNFAVAMTPASIASATGSGITLVQPPVFLPASFNPAGPFTFAQAVKIFHFQYKAHPTADRYLIDTYYRP